VKSYILEFEKTFNGKNKYKLFGKRSMKKLQTIIALLIFSISAFGKKK